MQRGLYANVTATLYKICLVYEVYIIQMLYCAEISSYLVMCYKNLPKVKTFSSDILKTEMEMFTGIHVHVHAKPFSCLKTWLQNLNGLPIIV